MLCVVVSRQAFAWVVRALLNRGFRFTVIGGTVVELAVGSKDLGEDIDVFGEDPSPFLEDEYFRLGEELGWVVGQTWLGTPRVVARFDGEEVPVEFYDNLHDFYVPGEMLARAERVRIGDVRVRMVRLEDHLALKAHAGRGVDMERLKEISRLVKRGKLKVDRDALLEAASLFGDEEKVVIRRLREAGLL